MMLSHATVQRVLTGFFLLSFALSSPLTSLAQETRGPDQEDMPMMGFPDAPEHGQQGPGMRSKGDPQKGVKGHRSEGFFSQLGLTDEQKQKLKALREQSHASGNRQAVRQKRQELMQMLRSGSGTKEQALSKYREVAQTQNAMMEARIAKVYQLKAILTPEQFQKMQQRHEQQRQNHPRGQKQRSQNRQQAQSMGDSDLYSEP